MLVLSNASLARGWTNTATVKDVEIIRSQGFQITGDFGNPSECVAGDSVFISIDHPQYDQLLSLSLSAFMADKKLRIYSHECADYGWHGGTHNELTVGGAMYIKK